MKNAGYKDGFARHSKVPLACNAAFVEKPADGCWNSDDMAMVNKLNNQGASIPVKPSHRLGKNPRLEWDSWNAMYAYRMKANLSFVTPHIVFMQGSLRSIRRINHQLVPEKISHEELYKGLGTLCILLWMTDMAGCFQKGQAGSRIISRGNWGCIEQRWGSRHGLKMNEHQALLFRYTASLLSFDTALSLFQNLIHGGEYLCHGRLLISQVAQR